MPRPRTASDADILMAAWRAVSQVGPADLTLADVAREAGLSPATLVQRFGSKRKLLLTLAKLGSTSSAAEMASLRKSHPSPLAAILAYADCMAGMAPTPKELANHLAFLVIDLTDDEFRHYALEHAQIFQKELIAMLDDAVRARELIPCDTQRLARLVHEVIHGSLVTWAIYREGAAQSWVRQDVEMLLSPYLLKKGTRGKSTTQKRHRRQR